jgi:hypothetical protein
MIHFQDDFNRPNGRLGGMWTDPPDSFEQILDALTIVNGAVESEVGASGTERAGACVSVNVHRFSPWQRASLVYRAIGSADYAGPAVRFDPTKKTGYIFHADGSSSSSRRIRRVDGDDSLGVVIGTVNLVPSAGDTVTLAAHGSVIAAYINGALVDAATDTTYAFGQPGMWYNRGNLNVTELTSFSAQDLRGLNRRGFAWEEIPRTRHILTRGTR